MVLLRGAPHCSAAEVTIIEIGIRARCQTPVTNICFIVIASQEVAFDMSLLVPFPELKTAYGRRLPIWRARHEFAGQGLPFQSRSEKQPERIMSKSHAIIFVISDLVSGAILLCAMPMMPAGGRASTNSHDIIKFMMQVQEKLIMCRKRNKNVIYHCSGSSAQRTSSKTLRSHSWSWGPHPRDTTRDTAALSHHPSL